MGKSINLIDTKIIFLEKHISTDGDIIDIKNGYSYIEVTSDNYEKVKSLVNVTRRSVNYGLIFSTPDLIKDYIIKVFRKYEVVNSVSLDLKNKFINLTVDGETYLLENFLVYRVIDNKKVVDVNLTEKNIDYLTKTYLPPFIFSISPHIQQTLIEKKIV